MEEHKDLKAAQNLPSTMLLMQKPILLHRKKPRLPIGLRTLETAPEP
jgi:hypothetical protein